MTKELKELIDEVEVMFSFLGKNHLKWLKTTIKQAYLQGKIDSLKESIKTEDKNATN